MTLQHEMERVGQFVAADRELKLTLRGVDAYSVPGHINLPNVEHFAWLGEDARRMMHALVDHEGGHGLFSDHEVAAAAAGDPLAIRHVAKKYRDRFDHERIEALKRCASPALKMLANALEDGWTETRTQERYPGARYNLRKKNRWFIDRSKAERSFAKMDKWAQYMMVTTMLTRNTGITLDDFDGMLLPETQEMLDNSKDLISEMARVRDSGHSLHVALRVFQRFEETEEEPEPPPEPDEPDEGEEESEDDKPRADSDGTDESEGEDEADGGSSDSDPGDDSGEDDSDAGSEGAGDGDSSEDGSEAEGEGGSSPGEASGDAEGSGEPGEGDSGTSGERPPMEGHVEMDLKRWTPGGGTLNPEDRITREIKTSFETPTHGVRPYVIFSNEFDFVRDLTDVRHPDESRWRTLLEESAQAAEALTSAFEVTLRSRQEKRPIGGADEGMVDVESMVEFCVGARRPDTMYTQWVAEDDTTVAVSVLIDCSGSMGSFEGSHYREVSPSRLAAVTGTAIHRALSTVGIDHEIGGFTCLSSHGSHNHKWVTANPSHATQVREAFDEMRAALTAAAARGTDVTKFARAIYGRGAGGFRGRGHDPAHAELLVPAHAVFKRFGSPDARGLCWVDGIHENLDGEAVLWQARRLAQRPEQRRVMFVLSDGQPAGSRDNAQGRRFLKEAVQRVTDAGIEIYGIGIQSAAVLEYYPKAWVCGDVNELINVALGSMIEVILEGRREQRWVTVA